MTNSDIPHSAERENTDESLRLEREKADRVLEGDTAGVEETADDVISRARARADELLRAARARSDRHARTDGTVAMPAALLKHDRMREDQVLYEERAHADETLREERAEHVALLSHERESTDSHLSRERARSDEALATRDDFLGVVSHDLRNMLSSMVNFADVIARGGTAGDAAANAILYAQRIGRAGARMNRLIGDLVDVASIEAGVLAVTREWLDPTAIVAEAVENFQTQATANGLSLVAAIGSPLPRLPLDPARILQVLTNLLGNAIKFTPRGGTVTVRVERLGSDLYFAVEDTGVGIPADKREAVFVRFVQVADDRRGVGLGLYISRSVVLGHGGRIWIAGGDGAVSGSTFCFTLPLSIDN